MERERLAVAQRDRLLRGVVRDVGHAHTRAFAGEQDRRFAPHPAAGSRDHRDLPVQASHQPANGMVAAIGSVHAGLRMVSAID